MASSRMHFCIAVRINPEVSMVVYFKLWKYSGRQRQWTGGTSRACLFRLSMAIRMCMPLQCCHIHLLQSFTLCHGFTLFSSTHCGDQHFGDQCMELKVILTCG